MSSVYIFTLFLVLYFIQAWCKVIIKVIMVPKHQYCHTKAQKETLQSTNIWKYIKEGIPLTSDLNLVQIHLHRKVHLHIKLFLIRAPPDLIQRESFGPMQGYLIQIYV